MNSKQKKHSKTLWANAILALAAFLPSDVKQHITLEVALAVVTGVNFVLRFFTKDKIHFISND